MQSTVICGIRVVYVNCVRMKSVINAFAIYRMKPKPNEKDRAGKRKTEPILKH